MLPLDKDDIPLAEEVQVETPKVEPSMERTPSIKNGSSMSDNPKFASTDARSKTQHAFSESQSYSMCQSFVFLVTLGMATFNLYTDYLVYEALGALEAQVAGLTDTNNSFNSSQLQDGEVCDVAFLSNNTGQVVGTVTNLKSATYIVFWVSVVPAAFNILFKLATVVDLWRPSTSDSDGQTHANELDPVVNPGLPFQGLIRTGNNAKRRKFHKQRLALRSETLFYFLSQITEDVPQALIIFFYFTATQSSRGVACLECVSGTHEAGTCAPETVFSSTNQVLSLSLGVIIASLVLNGIFLAQHWVHFDRKKRALNNEEPMSAVRFTMVVSISVLVYAAVIVTPLFALIHWHVGPVYYGLEGIELVPYMVLFVIGSVVWLVGFSIFCCVCGVEAGESIFTTCALCEIAGECGEMCELCEGCCCCCC